jgi:hypothetical protein
VNTGVRWWLLHSEPVSCTCFVCLVLKASWLVQQACASMQFACRMHDVDECADFCLFCSCRFPLQLELLAPEEIPSMIMPPTEYVTPANVGWLYEQGKDIEEVRHASWDVSHMQWAGWEYLRTSQLWCC